MVRQMKVEVTPPVARPTADETRQRRVAASRQVVQRSVTEAQLQSEVEKIAMRAGWRIYHTRRSKGSAEGFPDLVAVRGNRVLYAELKTQRGVVSAEQTKWLDDLAGAGCEAYLWRPSDMEELGRVLCGRTRPLRSSTAWPLVAA